MEYKIKLLYIEKNIAKEWKSRLLCCCINIRYLNKLTSEK